MTRRGLPPFLRFALVIGAGLAIDLGTAWCLANLAGLPLAAAAVAGFLAGALFNYVLHELWTFRAPGRGLSVSRAALYLAMMAGILGVRLVIIAALSRVLSGPAGSLAVLVAAAGASFTVNYLLSRFVIYRRRESRDRGPDTAPS